MATADETLSARTILGGPLATGVDTVSLRQTVTFDLYVRVVLPIDGYVFWLKATQASDSALFNASALNRFANDQGPTLTPLPPGLPAPQFTALGSLHYATDSRQTDDANFSANRVVFTSEEPLQDMNAIGANLMYIGTFDGPTAQTPVAPRTTTPIRFAFSSRGSFYRQTDLYHYTGYAVYPTMSTQIVDDPGLLQTNRMIVSNSLPIWLYFSQFTPPWPVQVARPSVPFFPSMLAIDNEKPPFATVHIEPGQTTSYQEMPTLDVMSNSEQLVRDTVVFTMYGCSNDTAQDLLYSIMQYSYDSDTLFGIVNMPVIRDEKEGQNELNTLAQKKRIVFEVSYNQQAVRNIARQLIKHCLISVQVSDVVLAQRPIINL